MAISLIQMVARHEGFRPTVYCDDCGHALERAPGGWICDCHGTGKPEGNLTIGYGTRVDGAGLTQDEGRLLLQERIGRDANELMRAPWYASLDEARRAAILDMAYTMGVAGVQEFKGMIAALDQRDYVAAARAALDSKWAREAPKRAHEIADILRSGLMPD